MIFIYFISHNIHIIIIKKEPHQEALKGTMSLGVGEEERQENTGK